MVAGISQSIINIDVITGDTCDSYGSFAGGNSNIVFTARQDKRDHNDKNN